MYHPTLDFVSQTNTIDGRALWWSPYSQPTPVPQMDLVLVVTPSQHHANAADGSRVVLGFSSQVTPHQVVSALENQLGIHTSSWPWNHTGSRAWILLAPRALESCVREQVARHQVVRVQQEPFDVACAQYMHLKPCVGWGPALGNVEFAVYGPRCIADCTGCWSTMCDDGTLRCLLEDAHKLTAWPEPFVIRGTEFAFEPQLVTLVANYDRSEAELTEQDIIDFVQDAYGLTIVSQGSFSFRVSAASASTLADTPLQVFGTDVAFCASKTVSDVAGDAPLAAAAPSATNTTAEAAPVVPTAVGERTLPAMSEAVVTPSTMPLVESQADISGEWSAPGELAQHGIVEQKQDADGNSDDVSTVLVPSQPVLARLLSDVGEQDVHEALADRGAYPLEPNHWFLDEPFDITPGIQLVGGHRVEYTPLNDCCPICVFPLGASRFSVDWQPERDLQPLERQDGLTLSGLRANESCNTMWMYFSTPTPSWEHGHRSVQLEGDYSCETALLRNVVILEPPTRAAAFREHPEALITEALTDVGCSYVHIVGGEIPQRTRWAVVCEPVTAVVAVLQAGKVFHARSRTTLVAKVAKLEPVPSLIANRCPFRFRCSNSDCGLYHSAAERKFFSNVTADRRNVAKLRQCTRTGCQDIVQCTYGHMAADQYCPECCVWGHLSSWCQASATLAFCPQRYRCSRARTDTCPFRHKDSWKVFMGAVTRPNGQQKTALCAYGTDCKRRATCWFAHKSEDSYCLSCSEWGHLRNECTVERD